MSDWYGAARSNTFKVKDLEAFKKALEDLEIDIHEHHDGVVLLACTEYGSWPTWRDVEDSDEMEEIDLVAIIAPHLPEDQIVVLMEAGAEKLRYISGWAQAFNHKGEEVSLALDNIYGMAAERFGIEPTPATY